MWEELSTRLTPADDFFFVSHYGHPVIDPTTWRLGIDGLVAQPGSLSLADLKSRPRKQVEFTLECSGNTAFPVFTGAVGNAVWGGASLAPILKRARPLESAAEVVFWGTDSGTVTIRDNPGIVSPPTPGTGSATPDPDIPGRWDITITEQFARSMSIDAAMATGNLLCYEMNGQPLPVEHGFPVRLIAPGWYGVANVKWLKRIELIDHRYRRPVHGPRLRHLPRAHRRGWQHDVDLPDRRPLPLEVRTRQGHPEGPGDHEHVPGHRRRLGWTRRPGRGLHRRRAVALGACCRPRLPRRPDPRLWRGTSGPTTGAGPPAGHHTVTSRAIDTHGAIQPAPDDPIITDRRTYWEANQQITRTILLP